MAKKRGKEVVDPAKEAKSLKKDAFDEIELPAFLKVFGDF